MIHLNFQYKLLIALLSVLIFFSSENQVSAQIYQGGIGDGYSDKRYLGNLRGKTLQGIFLGGGGDGYASTYRKGLLSGIEISTLYSGGPGDGFSEERASENLQGISIAGMFKGGSGDGYDAYWVRGSLRQSLVFPIELLSFEATIQDETVLLQWATATELNHAHFTIERSVNARDFEYVKEVAGSGNSHQVQRYEALDEQPYGGTSFYRLKSVDVDGGYEYSQTIQVNFQTQAPNELILYPNPNSGDILSLRWQRETSHGQVSIHIKDLQGREIYSKQLNNSASLIEAKIPLGNAFKKGVYVLTIKSASLQQSKLFIIH